MDAESPSDHSLRTSEAKFRAMFERSALGMARVRFADARWIDVNDAFCQMLGHSRDEMLLTSWPDITHPDDVGPDLTLFERMAVGELDMYTLEKRFLHAKGHPVWVKLTLSLVRDANGNPYYEIAVIEDIDDRKAAEQELADSRLQLEAERARLQAIVDTIPTGLIMVDEAGAITLENAEWKRTWASNSVLNSVVDYDIYKGFRPDTGERISPEEWPCAKSLKEGIQTRDVILDIERLDGTRGTIVVSSAPIRADTGRIVGAVAANMDITELRAAQAQLVEADRRKDDFLAMLSHELRNPLAPIQNSLYILDRVDPAGPQARHARKVIGRQVTHLTDLVDDLLDVTRIAKGKIELDRTQLDVAALVRRTAGDYRALIQGRGIEFIVAITDEPLIVEGDETRLAQVLGNLLTNAMNFTLAGGRITLTVDARAERALVYVCDNGTGISPDVLPTIFDPFTQASQNLARSQGGLGLGLALVKGVVDLHAGSVTARSTPGAGTEFVVELPLVQATEPTLREFAETSSDDARSYRVLVADDNTDFADSLAALVTMFGHTVEVAYDGRSAIRLAEAKQHDLGKR